MNTPNEIKDNGMLDKLLNFLSLEKLPIEELGLQKQFNISSEVVQRLLKDHLVGTLFSYSPEDPVTYESRYYMDDLAVNEFYKSELGIILDDENRPISVEDITEQLEKSFCNYFNFKKPGFDEFYGNSGFHLFDPHDKIRRLLKDHLVGTLFSYSPEESVTYESRYYMNDLAVNEFYKSEIGIILDDENRPISIEDIIEQLEKSFCNYFNFEKPGFDGFYGNIGFHLFEPYDKIQSIISQNNHLFYKIVSPQKSNYNDLVGLNKWGTQIFYPQYSRFEYSILYNFRKSKRESLDLKNLDFRINRSPLELDITKPISMEYVISQLEIRSDIYSFDKEGGKVIVKNDLVRIKKILQSNSLEFLKFQDFVQSHRLGSSGILSLAYTGPNFRLTEASEYVKLRNIIFITRTYSLYTDFKKLFDFNKIDDSEFLLTLSAIIGEKNLEVWVEENIKISFYEEYFEPTDSGLIYLERRIIKDLSPLLNLEGN
ncbi:MAG: hypothetical protein Q8Q47_09670, partial [Ignavibacteriaceae bacterium]|nr:hypothetical protein [Ignavibacteriaceae bacterium]